MFYIEINFISNTMLKFFFLYIKYCFIIFTLVTNVKLLLRW